MHKEFDQMKIVGATVPGELAKSVPGNLVYRELPQVSARHGMLWSVYDDCIVATRREFISGLSLGDDWVMPLPAAEPKPFAFSQSARRFAAPEFPEGAELKAIRTVLKGKGKGEETPIVKIAVPAVTPDPKARCLRYRIEVRGEGGGDPVRFFAAPEGVGHAALHKKAKVHSFYDFALKNLPAGKLAIAVVPENSFGRQGCKLEVEI